MSAQGTTTVNFGAFPGASDTSVAVTGQANIVAGSLVEAWIRPEATADHSADEHWAEDIFVVAGNIVAATGFTIYARIGGAPAALAEVALPRGPNTGPAAGETGYAPANPATRLYGQYTVAWVWN